MLGSPRTPLALLEEQLQSKIAEIAGIKNRLQAEMQDRQDILQAKTRLRATAQQISRIIQTTKITFSQLRSSSTQFFESIADWMRPFLASQFDRLRRQHHKQVLRLTTELGRVNAQQRLPDIEALSMRRHTSEHNAISQFVKEHEQPIALKRCLISQPTNYGYVEEIGASPALEIPCPQLQPIAEEKQVASFHLHNMKSKSKSQISTGALHLIRSESTELCLPVSMPTARASNPRQEPKLKELNKDKVCIEDLARLIDKVTPSKAVIKNAVDRIQQKQFSKVSEDCISNCHEDHENKLQKTGSVNQSSLSRGISVIELGNRKRSLSKEKVQSRQQREAPSNIKVRDQNIKSQSKQKIKVTVKEVKPDLFQSRSISRPDRKPSYHNNTTIYKPDNRGKPFSQLHTQLVEQLSRIELCAGNRKYELRFEGSRKQNARCGFGRLEYINGLVYEGEFKEDLREGYGVLSFNGKEIYCGDWRADQMSGRGILKNFHSICRRKLSEQSLLRTCTYDGEFRGNALHGHGKFTFANGQRYEGYFHNNVPQNEFTILDRSFCLETSQFQV